MQVREIRENKKVQNEPGRSKNFQFLERPGSFYTFLFSLISLFKILDKNRSIHVHYAHMDRSILRLLSSIIFSKEENNGHDLRHCKGCRGCEKHGCERSLWQRH